MPGRSLDVEGHEEEALSSFDFAQFEVEVLTVERPREGLAKRLASHGYAYVCDTSSYGDELWVRVRLQTTARARLVTSNGVSSSPLRPPIEHSRHRERAHAWCSTGRGA